MNILLIDDQQEVLNGLMIGVDWKKLKIEEVFQANSSAQAKAIIETQMIDLMLCDIEMPLGSGLDLYEWVVDEGYEIKCIFLTAHASFQYTQRAIRLQGFDYLLQPATYSEIETVVLRAMEEISINRMNNDYYKYAKQAKNREYLMCSYTMRDFLLGHNRDVNTVLQAPSITAQHLDASSMCHGVLLQIFSWQDDKWSNDLFLYALQNMIKELFGDLVGGIVIAAINKNFYYIMLEQSQYCSAKQIQTMLENYMLIFPRSFGCQVAMYQGSVASFDKQPEIYQSLLDLSRHNVTAACELWTDTHQTQQKIPYIAPDFQKWDSMIARGHYDLVHAEAIDCIQQKADNGQIDQSFLQHFHQDYTNWFFNLLRKGNQKAQLSFDSGEDGQYNYESMLQAYTSVARMKSLISFTIQYLKSLSGVDTMPEDRTQEILHYIHDNIEKNITRKELADAVFLNPEYLSRFFKKEIGCTLSEFVLREKMNLAKSLLDRSKLSVSIVASKVGYSNFSYFSQCFKKEFGETPSEYRQNRHA